MQYWRNPLIITEAMREHRIDDKVSIVVMMPASDFLRLALASDDIYKKEDILRRLERGYAPESLEQYNLWALDPGMKGGYPRSPMQPVNLTISPTQNPAVWEVAGHEGRHRVAAMWVAGEDLVEVSITMDHDRTASILDLPPIIEGETWLGDAKSNHKFDTRGIGLCE